MSFPRSCEAIVQTLVAHEDVVGVVLGGSCARGDALDASDTDLFVYVRAEVSDRIRSVEDGLRSAGPVLQLPPRHVAAFGWSITCMFADGAIVQANVNDPESVPMNPMRERGRILYDPLGVCRDVQERARRIDVDLHVVEHAAGTRLLVRLIFCVRAIRKGELLRARSLLLETVELLAVLHRIELQAFDAAIHWSHPLKRLERDLPVVGRELFEIVGTCESAAVVMTGAERVRERAVQSGRVRGWLDERVERLVADEFDRCVASKSVPSS